MYVFLISVRFSYDPLRTNSELWLLGIEFQQPWFQQQLGDHYFALSFTYQLFFRIDEVFCGSVLCSPQVCGLILFQSMQLD